MKLCSSILIALIVLASTKVAPANARLDGFRNLLDLPYANSDHPRQTLNLYLPENPVSKKIPLIAYIHGGAWRKGDKSFGIHRIRKFLRGGQFAAASIGYRLTDEGPWPLQIHDCKAAIRWLKANADQYGYDASNIAVMGNSAGGHLVAMLGVSADVPEMSGRLGLHLDMDTRVKCVVDFCGPANLLTMVDQPSTMRHDTPDSPEGQLVGGYVRKRSKVALDASPQTHVSKADAPILVVHGDKDPLVPVQQARDFHEALLKGKVDSTLVILKGMGHGLRHPELDRRIEAFFAKHLLGENVEISGTPILTK